MNLTAELAKETLTNEPCCKFDQKTFDEWTELTEIT